MLAFSTFALVALLGSEEPVKATPVQVRRTTAITDNAPPAAEPPPHLTPEPLLIPHPTFEAGAVVVGDRRAHLAGGPSFRVTLRDGNLLMAGSLDWAIALSGGRTLLLGGGGVVRDVLRRFEVYGLGLGGIDAVNGPPVGLYPVIALRLGGNWNAKHWLVKTAGLSTTVAYDVPYLWARTSPAEGLSVSLTAAAAFELGR